MMTPRKIKARFEAEGVSLAEWARARGYNYRTVVAVLNGRLSGKRGVSHKIAVELGLKAEPETLQFRAVVDAA
ncbi:DNA-binding protein [Rhodopseudomonas palustris]|nr:DNA-binding protein [Rhodopseudomonas palustris]